MKLFVSVNNIGLIWLFIEGGEKSDEIIQKVRAALTNMAKCQFIQRWVFSEVEYSEHLNTEHSVWETERKMVQLSNVRISDIRDARLVQFEIFSLN